MARVQHTFGDSSNSVRYLHAFETGIELRRSRTMYRPLRPLAPLLGASGPNSRRGTRSMSI